MSTFEPAEVDALAAGGNAAAALTWLGALSREQIIAMAPLKTAKQVVRARQWPCGRVARAPTCSFCAAARWRRMRAICAEQGFA